MQWLAQHGTAADFQRLLTVLVAIGAAEQSVTAHQLRNLLGMHLRQNLRMQRMALKVWAGDPCWQRVLLHWFVDELALDGYYGQLLGQWAQQPLPLPEQHFVHGLLLKQALARQDAAAASAHAEHLAELPIDFVLNSVPWPLARSLTYRMVWAYQAGHRTLLHALQQEAEAGLAHYQHQSLSSWDHPIFLILLTDAYLHTRQDELALALATTTFATARHPSHRAMLAVQQAEAYISQGRKDAAVEAVAAGTTSALAHQPSTALMWLHRYQQVEAAIVHSP